MANLNDIPKQPVNRNQPPQASSSARLKGVERNLQQLTNFVNGLVPAINQGLSTQFGNVFQQLNDMREILTVLVEEFGTEEVDARIQAKRKAHMEGQIAQAKASIERNLADGILVPVDSVVDEKTMIVGHEVNAAGENVSDPPWASLTLTHVPDEEIRKRFIGAKVGDKVETMNGVAFVVEAAYVVDEARAAELAAQQTKAAEEAAKAVAEAPSEPSEGIDDGVQHAASDDAPGEAPASGQDEDLPF